MGEEIVFENGWIYDFQRLVTLPLDRIILHTVMHHSSTSTYIPTFIEMNKLFVDWRTFETHFIRSTQRSRPDKKKQTHSQILASLGSWLCGRRHHAGDRCSDRSSQCLCRYCLEFCSIRHINTVICNCLRQNTSFWGWNGCWPCRILPTGEWWITVSILMGQTHRLTGARPLHYLTAIFPTRPR